MYPFAIELDRRSHLAVTMEYQIAAVLVDEAVGVGFHSVGCYFHNSEVGHSQSGPEGQIDHHLAVIQRD